LGALLGVVAAGGLMKVSFDDAKIRARSRAEAVRYAYDHGLVSPPP
jgi:hypothetical protein